MRFTKTVPMAALAAAAVLTVGGDVLATGIQSKVPMPRGRPVDPASTASVAAPRAQPAAPEAPAAIYTPASLPPTAPAFAPGASTPASDIAAVKQAIEKARRGDADAATEIQKSISDPVARKLVEWVILRSDDNGVGFARYVSFVTANPGWPSTGMLRRRAENMLWQERRDAAQVRAFFASSRPLTPKGKLALARALMAEGDRASAHALVRDAWRNDNFSRDLEADVIEAFPGMIDRADYKARMDRRLYDDAETGLRMAQKLGPAEVAIAKARIAVNEKEDNGGKLLEAVPHDARRDPGYVFARLQWLRRQDKFSEAAQLMLSAPRDPGAIHNTDEWWVERRLLARKLLDAGDARNAYLVARDAAPPSKENYRAEHQFTAGWIALRFLNDPATAAAHFARVGQGNQNPIALARAGYWQGRAAEAAGRRSDAMAHYEAAARYPTAYYGQIARARLGHGELTLARVPAPSDAQRLSLRQLEVVRAIELLYAVDARELVIPAVADLADRMPDAGALAALAELAGKHNDARAQLLIGKNALARGLALDYYAFPAIGVPQFSNIGPEIDRSVVYSIVRQESAFNQKTVSTANALGLMQVTPDAGRYVAKKFNVGFDKKRLLTDPVYNTQLGAAELADLIRDYRGSYIMSFAGYNAGRGRVRDWVERYGDPRDPNVDPIDWVERIPFAETRNYVQRVMENMQVYRARFNNGGARLMIEADLRRGGARD